MSQYIRTKRGVPQVSDFAAGDGTPIVIDVLTGVGYFLAPGNVVRPLQFKTDVSGSFSDGFSNGFA